VDSHYHTPRKTGGSSRHWTQIFLKLFSFDNK
jgi:hypothetical protein